MESTDFRAPGNLIFQSCLLLRKLEWHKFNKNTVLSLIVLIPNKGGHNKKKCDNKNRFFYSIILIMLGKGRDHGLRNIFSVGFLDNGSKHETYLFSKSCDFTRYKCSPHFVPRRAPNEIC